MLTIEQTCIGPNLLGPEADSTRMAYVGMRREGEFYISTKGAMFSPAEALQMAVEIGQCADAIDRLNGTE